MGSRPPRAAPRPDGGTSLGPVLHRARLARGLTQARLARAVVAEAAAAGEVLHLSASAISRWEAGAFEPAARYRPFLSRVLEVDLHLLLPPLPDDRPA